MFWENLLRTIMLAIVLAIACSGCQNKPVLRPTDASVSLGGSMKGAYGHTESAEYDIQQAKRFIGDKTGDHFIDAASQEHAAVLRELLVGMKQLDSANAEYAASFARSALLEGDIRSMKESSRWRYGGWVVWGIRFVFIWAFVVVSFPVLALMVPGWGGWIIGVVGRLANPIGWGQWYAEKKRVNTALYMQPPQG